MQIPAIFYGRYRDVRQSCRKAITRFRRGSPWLAALEAEGVLDATDAPGLLVLDGSRSGAGGTANFYLYVPLSLLQSDRSIRPLSPAQEEDVFTTSLQRPWSLLTLFDRQLMYWWFRHTDPEIERQGREGNVERYQRYVRALCAMWGLLHDEGRRYYGLGSMGQGEDLWDAATAPPHVLARLGVPTGQISLRGVMLPLPPGGLSGLLTMSDHSRADGLLRDLRPSSHASGPHRQPERALPESFEMMDALLAHDTSAVRRLADAQDYVNAPDVVTGTTPLAWAARHGYIDLLRDLLEHGAQPDERCRADTPLMLAAWGGHRDVVRLLLEWGADPTVQEPFSWDAIGYAETMGHDEVAALLRAARERHLAEKAKEA